MSRTKNPEKRAGGDHTTQIAQMAEPASNMILPKQVVIEQAGLVSDLPGLLLEREKLDADSNRFLREITLITLLVLFALTNLTTLALYVLQAVGKTDLSPWALGELAGMTAAEVASLLYFIVRCLFPIEATLKKRK